MTELSFLLELLLKHKLPAATRDLVAQRIKEVEIGLLSRPQFPQTVQQQISGPQPPFIVTSGVDARGVQQSASTLAAMARQAAIVGEPVPQVLIESSMVFPPSTQPAIVAQTPAAMQAMNSRNQAISESLSGKVDKTTGRPRKF